ncbi:cation:proton antiporter [Georgenia sp. Z1344]|uniref:cation:proton antiporter n=1 Tax=Georgenia sp. Z1344 TaxID=3416706 RepID=UPI003CE856D4
MTEVMAVVGNVVVVLGALVFATAALGLVRFPDVYMRISGVGTAGGFGIILVVVGCLLIMPSWRNLGLALLVIGIHLATSSVGTMVVARAAYLTGVPLRRRSFDDLADETERRAVRGDTAAPDDDERAADHRD